jgi:8-oxo-dGTP diphosphatase
MSNNPFLTDRIVSGALVYTLHHDAVLLLKRERPPHKGLWSPPGGKLDLGESPEDCARRELREETGLSITDLRLRGVLTVVDRAYPIHWLLFVFRARVAEEQHSPYPALTPCAEGELKWIPLAQLEQYPRPYADTRCFSRVLDESPIFQSKFLYDTPHTLVGEWHYT